MRLTHLLLLTVLVHALAPFATAAEPKKPNIVLIMTDDQGYAQLGRHGHPWLDTPHMDDLYDHSTRFTRFLVSPTCAPTRSAMMTGRHPLQNGVTHTILERERMTLDATILPQVLKTAGYTSGIFGKWHLGDEDPYQPHNRGFDEAFIHGGGGIGQSYECSCADAPDNEYFDPAIKHNGSFVKTDGYCTDLFFTAALGFMKKQSEKQEPFFAYIATNAPHGPFIAPEKNTKKFTDLGFSDKHAGYYGMIENIDENLGRLVSHLGKWDLLDDTMIIFMSDNGTTGGGSGRPGHVVGTKPDGTELRAYNGDMKGLKGSADEGGVRVPFFVRWDGVVKPGQEIDRIAAHIDLLPTLADIAGAELPNGQVAGRSLWPLIQNPEADWKGRLLFTHVGRWPTGANPDDFQWKKFAVRNQRYRLVEDQLYDMRNDPGQTKDIADEHPEVVQRLRRAYDQFWQKSRPLMVNESAPMSPVRPFHVQFEQQQAAGGIPQWQVPEL
ncbi:arylsulfatase [Rubinisphaera margarita]|uniref:arylsulfatase n=1 Tax=Rubinisphaera margarita TaxID=2909586 RepID=UPI001EE91A46|nr:arylsulfatase [Rubinisphaera margarita]MCG6157435.1 arylsulfatase [Rubinisphaera margarita]